MSGGSHDYAFAHVSSMADILKRDPRSDRRAFGLHLENIAQAMHDIEWVDSGDYSPDGDALAIQACLSEEMILDVLYKNADRARDELDKAIKEFKDRQAKKTKRKASKNFASNFEIGS